MKTEHPLTLQLRKSISASIFPMTPKNTSKLFATYPLLYRNLREQNFECGDGWFDLVWQVSAEIEKIAQLEGIPKTAEAWPSVGILKQKFGTLRVQFDTRDDAGVIEAIRAVTAKSYEQSKEVCELCGAKAQLDETRASGRWMEVLCDACRKAH